MSNIFFYNRLKNDAVDFQKSKIFLQIFIFINWQYLAAFQAVEFLNDCKNGAHVSYEHDVLQCNNLMIYQYMYYITG